MKKLLSLVLCIMLILGGVALPVSAAPIAKAPASSAIQGELIVSIVGTENSNYSTMSTTSATHTQALQVSGFTVKNALHESISKALSSSGRMSASAVDGSVRTMGHVYLVKYGSQFTSYDQAAQALKQELAEQGLKVKYIEPNYKLHALGYTASMHTSQEWHYNMIKAPQAWNITQGSSNVKIAILDTGIDSTHQSLANFINMGLAKNFTADTPNSDVTDRQGHGTHVAGTIASYGSVSGVMKAASLVPVKVLGDDGSGSLYGIVEGITYAASIGADVISMSLGGGGFDQSMSDACQNAYNKGTVVVAATGNDGINGVSYPAKYNYVIGVGSVDSSRARSSFSNYGTGLDVMAPGHQIYSTYMGNSYKILSGTSMATPHVSGVVGLIRSVNKSLTPAQVEDILKRTCQPAGVTTQYGSGIVDAYEAVKAAGGIDVPVDKTTVTTLTVNKSVYKPGETAVATVTVKDEKGVVLSGAAVKLTLTQPSGATSVQNATTSANGIATFNMAVSALGQYSVKVDVSLANYTSSVANTSFKVENTSTNITVTGWAYSDLKTFTSNYYGYTLYNTSAVIYVVLSDGTNYKHGTVSATSWYGYPDLSKTISGTAKATSNGQKVTYRLKIYLEVN